MINENNSFAKAELETFCYTIVKNAYNCSQQVIE